LPGIGTRISEFSRTYPQGDDILLETRQGEFLYRVKSFSVISPDNKVPLQATPDAQLSLITCYPFYYVGMAPKRFVVEAQLADAVFATLAPVAPPGL